MLIPGYSPNRVVSFTRPPDRLELIAQAHE